MAQSWLRMAGMSPGLQVWKIDNKSQQVSEVPKNAHGMFNEADTYLVLSTVIDFKNGSDKSYVIHLWAGSATDQEECGREKLKLLFDKLQIDHRDIETQKCNSETDDFKALFPHSRLRYVKPVVLQAAVNVRTDDYPISLYQLKGKKDAYIKQVDVTKADLENDSVFVLDANEKIFQWNGKLATRMVKGKALDLTTRMRDERMNRCKAQVIIHEEGEESEDFWTIISKRDIVSMEGKTDDKSDDIDVSYFNPKSKIYKIVTSHYNQDHSVEEIDTLNKPFDTQMLDPGFSFIIDFEYEMYLWYGRFAPLRAKTVMPIEANKLVESSNRKIKIHLVEHGVEPILLKRRFQGFWLWKSKNASSTNTPEGSESGTSTPSLSNSTSNANTPVIPKKKVIDFVNIDELHHPEKYLMAREELRSTIPYSNIEGVSHRILTLWHVKDNDKVELPLTDHGLFYSFDSYILLFSVRLQNGHRNHVVYYWQGHNSHHDDRGTAALLATGLAHDSRRSGCELVRVLEGQEPDHFISHFAGVFCLKQAKRGDETKREKCLFHIRGNSKFTVQAFEVEPVVFSLNSSDIFVLANETNNTLYSWIGKGSNQFQKDFLVTFLAKFYSNYEATTINESAEPAQFWESLGKFDTTAYCHIEDYYTSTFQKKFFICHDKTGPFVVSPSVENFYQEHLEEKSVVIFDVGIYIFFWISSSASKRNIERGKKLVIEYRSTLDDEQRRTCPIYEVLEGQEPKEFTFYFHIWHYLPTEREVKMKQLRQISKEELYENISKRKLVELIYEEEKEESQDTNNVVESAGKAGGHAELNPSNLVVPWERLKIKPLPDGVNGANIEAYLSADEFRQYFKIFPKEFYAFPKWKQIETRKKIGLF